MNRSTPATPDDPAYATYVRRVTHGSHDHHAPFFLTPAYDEQMQWLIFVAYPDRQPQIRVEVRNTGAQRPLTERADLHPWSLHPSRDGRFVYFTAGTSGYRVDVETGVETRLLDFPGGEARGEGMVAAGMGTTALSCDDRYWALKVRRGKKMSLVVLDTMSGDTREIVTTDVVAHVQFHPEDPTLVYFAGNFKERMWTVRVDGSELKAHYDRKPGEWITHESWLPGSDELMFVEWPHRVRALHVPTGRVREIVKMNAWHPSASPDGRLIVADTNAPDRGLILFPSDGGADPVALCPSAASNEGDHWWGPFPYEDGPISVIARQHTHPHPTFSPDGRHILFASDCSGNSHLYEIDLGAWRRHTSTERGKGPFS